MNPSVSVEIIIAQTKEWLEKAVIGLNLCPFAKSVYQKKQIRFVVSSSSTEEALLADLKLELQKLADTEASEIDTTLLIHPYVFGDFLDYNDFLGQADRVVKKMKLDDEIQIASFHPEYQFAGTDKEDVTNLTNRSPYQLLHLLREESVSKAVDSFPNVDQIPEKNMETLRKLGFEGWKKLGIPSRTK